MPCPLSLHISLLTCGRAKKNSLGPLVTKLPPPIIAPLMEKLSNLKLRNSVDNAVPSMALKAVIEALPRPTYGTVPTAGPVEAYSCISRVLIPRLLGRSIPATTVQGAKNVRLPDHPEGLLQSEYDLNAESVDVLIEVVRCFGPMLQPVEIEALQDTVVNLLERDKGTSVVKKRAVVAISILAVYLSDEILGTFISRVAAVLKDTRVKAMNRRLYITIIGLHGPLDSEPLRSAPR